MSNEQKFIITVAFNDFGVRYLITVSNSDLQEPDYPDGDERWLAYDPMQPVVDKFKAEYKKTIGRGEKDVDGTILFIEPTDLVLL